MLKDLDYDQLRDVRLRAAMGGPQAPLTDEKIPTLAEALELVVRGRLLVTLHVLERDLYDATFREVEKAGAQQQALFKMQAYPDEPRLRYAAFFGKTAFMPVLHECEPGLSGHYCSANLGRSMSRYRTVNPTVYEVSFQNKAFLRTRHTGEGWPKLWLNAIEPRLMGGMNEEEALRDPKKMDAVWGWLADNGAGVIQTNHPLRLKKYLEERKAAPAR
ncbi:MAG: hypothetical protein EBV03_04405 [Proteobacteria bacterium]|nr:hypothetical protein [Pseudomonadota bacterium]